MIKLPSPLYLKDWSYAYRDLNREPRETVLLISWIKNDYKQYGEALFPLVWATCRCGERFQHSHIIYKRTTCVYCLNETRAQSDRSQLYLQAKRIRDMAERDEYFRQCVQRDIAAGGEPSTVSKQALLEFYDRADRIPPAVLSLTDALKELAAQLDERLNDLNT